MNSILNNCTCSVQDLDILSYANIEPSKMKITPDAIDITYIDGTDQLGTLKVIDDIPEPALSYDTYTLTSATDMLAVTDGKFVPDTSLHTPTTMSGVIGPLIAGRDYKIIIGEQEYTNLYFKNGSEQIVVSVSGVWLSISNDILGGGFEYGKLESFVIRVTSNSIQLLKFNDHVVVCDAYKLSSDFDEVSIEASGFSTNVSGVSVQLGWATKLTDAPFLSAYFQAKTGKFSFTNSNANGNTIMIFGVEDEPTKRLTSLGVPRSFGIFAMTLDGQLRVGCGDLLGNSANGNSVMFTKDNPSANTVLTFEITGGDSMNIYIDDELMGSWTSNSALLKLPTFYQIVAINTLTSLDFYLGEAYETLEYHNPTDVDDCVYYHLTSSGELFGKPVKEGDFVQFYNNHSGIIHHPQ